MHAATDDPAFGGVGFRSLFTDAVWQGPTWSFAILLLVLDVGDTTPGWRRGLLVAGFSLVMGVTLVAVVVRWERLPARTQVLLPTGDLVGGLLVVVAVPASNAPTTVLLCSLPLVWLGFEFGWRAAAGGVVALVAVAATAPVVGGSGTGFASATMVVPVLFLIGLTVVAVLMRGVLDRVGATLRSRSEELSTTLVEAEERLVVLNGVMESIDAGVMVLRPGVQPVQNARAAAMVSRAGADLDLPGEPAHRVFTEDGVTPVPAEEQAIPRALAGQEFSGSVHRVGEPGDQLTLVTSARQLVRADGRAVGTVLSAWDATELMDAIRVREEFVATVSHELRTPLTAITASLELFGDLVGDDQLDDDGAQLLSSCLRNSVLLGDRISELMASTTSVARPLDSHLTDVSELVRLSLAKHDATLAAAGLALRVDVEGGLVVDLDPTRFEQVVDNLVSNAVKYTSTGSITVSLRRGASGVVLSVADTGRGMTRDEQRQAFDRFYRSPAARATATQGLGIGLGLVRSIVERHEGQVDLTSAPGEGTTVVVTIPVAREARLAG